MQHKLAPCLTDEKIRTGTSITRRLSLLYLIYLTMIMEIMFSEFANVFEVMRIKPIGVYARFCTCYYAGNQTFIIPSRDVIEAF